MTLIDTHLHLETWTRNGTLPSVLARAREAGVEAMITVGTSSEDWALYRDLAAAHPSVVHFSVGLHPCHVGENWESEVAQIAAFWGRARPLGAPGSAAAGPAVPPYPVALGECGLDRFHLPKDAAEAEKIFAWQRAAFVAQLALARDLACPLIVHSRGAFRETVEMIDASGVDWTRVVFHCFSEGPAEIAELNRRGGRGSFTGILTYKSAVPVRDAAKAQGLARLMVETDAPWLAPVPHRGEPNEPAYVRHTAEFAAKEIFGISLDELAAVTTANAKSFFGF
jgi:TatD DNase family protein